LREAVGTPLNAATSHCGTAPSLIQRFTDSMVTSQNDDRPIKREKCEKTPTTKLLYRLHIDTISPRGYDDYHDAAINTLDAAILIIKLLSIYATSEKDSIAVLDTTEIS
jgi:hypothetical protein